MPEQKTELKILYEDGKLEREKPYTYSVELRKWNTWGIFDCVDYVLLVSVITDNEMKAARQYKKVDEKYLLDVNSDGEAIGRAVDHFRALEKECEEKRKEVK